MISAERTRGLCLFLRKEMGIAVEAASEEDAWQKVLSRVMCLDVAQLGCEPEDIRRAPWLQLDDA